MNVIGKTNSGSVVLAMTRVEADLIGKVADGIAEVPSGCRFVELSEQQIEAFGALSKNMTRELRKYQN